MLDTDPALHRPGQKLMADKGYRSAAFEAELNAQGITLIRPTRKGERQRPHKRFLRPFRQIIHESVNQTLKHNSTSERHGGRKAEGSAPGSSSDSLALYDLAQRNHPATRTRPRHTSPHMTTNRGQHPWNYSSRSVAPGGQQLHHLPGDHRPGVLVLAGHQVAVDHPVVGEWIAKPGLGFEAGTHAPQLGLGVVRRRLDAQLRHLLVGDRRDLAPGDQQGAVGSLGAINPSGPWRTPPITLPRSFARVIASARARRTLKSNAAPQPRPSTRS